MSDDTRNIYQRLQHARLDLQATKLKKSGRNNHAKYDYFELADFLPTVQMLLHKHGLCGVMTFTAETATLRIIEMAAAGDYVIFSCPMSTAKLPACHEVQNLGAVITYIRRYLYTVAMEIVEHDAIEQLTAAPAPKQTAKAVQVTEPFNPAPGESVLVTGVSEPLSPRDEILQLATEMGYGKTDVSDLVKNIYEAKKFDDMTDEAKIAMLDDFRKKKATFLAICSNIEARDFMPGNVPSKAQIIDLAQAWLKDRFGDKPLRTAAPEWLLANNKLTDEVYK